MLYSSAVAAMEGAFNLKHMGSMPVQCTNAKKVWGLGFGVLGQGFEV